MAKENSQKFIGRNRAPRVQIEYDVEAYGKQKTVNLPFVMGVMADLSGKPETPLEPVSDRKFLEIDVENFDARMKSMKPRVQITVPNALTGEGELPVTLTFEKMEDLEPASIANALPSTRKLRETRDQLKNLMTYLDGKQGAEELITQLLANPELMKALTSAPKPEDGVQPEA